MAVAALRTGRSYTPGPPLNPPVHIKAIDGGIVANIPLYAGLDRGYFAAEGLDVELVGLQDVATSAQAIATNQVQFYIAVPDPSSSTPSTVGGHPHPGFLDHEQTG